MRYFIVDAFTNRHFAGNPAGVCLLEKDMETDLMQQIAKENNLPETAFIIKKDNGWNIRWFTPAFEMDLCGHATLASGFVVLNFCEQSSDKVTFASQSGDVSVFAKGDRLALDFPSRPPVEVPVPAGLAQSFGAKVLACYKSRDLIALVEDAETVERMTPDFAMMAAIEGDHMGVVPTAAGLDCDFVSRFFDPADGIIEDPVTGSAHCSLIPFWAKRLGKDQMVARQLSSRGGTLYCADLGQRVEIAGNAVLYLEGRINI